MQIPVHRGARRVVFAALIGGVLGAAAVHSEDFFPTRDENPLLRGFYRPLASDTPLAAGAVVGATLSIMNTLETERRANQQLLVDGESDTLRLTYDNQLGAAWRYRLTLPVVHDSGGFLDPAIDSWHRWLGLDPGSRPYYPSGRIIYSYVGRNTVLAQGTHTSVGDTSAEAGWYALDDARHTLSIWGGLEAPTGSTRHLTGDGAWDGALWAHAARRWPSWHVAAELGVVQPFGDAVFAGAAHRTSVFLRTAATRDVGPIWSLRAQLDGQTARVSGTNLRFLGPSAQLTVGMTRQLPRHWRLQLGIAEDAAVNTAPDITFFVGIHD